MRRELPAAAQRGQPAAAPHIAVGLRELAGLRAAAQAPASWLAAVRALPLSQESKGREGTMPATDTNGVSRPLCRPFDRWETGIMNGLNRTIVLS